MQETHATALYIRIIYKSQKSVRLLHQPFISPKYLNYLIMHFDFFIGRIMTSNNIFFILPRDADGDGPSFFIKTTENKGTTNLTFFHPTATPLYIFLAQTSVK